MNANRHLCDWCDTQWVAMWSTLNTRHTERGCAVHTGFYAS